MSSSRSRSRKTSLPSRSGYAPLRIAKLVSRAQIGSVATDGSGNVTTLGSYSVGTTSPFLIKPSNMGWVADLAAHFASWRLLKCRFVYTARTSVVSEAATAISGGVAVFGVLDDPARTVTPGSNLYELRSARQVRLDRDWTLDYVPTGPQAVWLETSMNSGSGTSISRQTCAGVLLAASVLQSTIASQVLGMLEVDFHVEFKGACLYVAPTMQVELKSESKKEEVVSAQASRSATARQSPLSLGGDFELVTIPLRRAKAEESKAPC